MFFRKKINFPRNANEAKDFELPSRHFPLARVLAIIALVALLGMMVMSGRYQKTRAVEATNGQNLADIANDSDINIGAGISAYIDQDKVFNNLNVSGTLEFRSKLANDTVTWPKLIIRGTTTVNGTIRAAYSHIGEYLGENKIPAAYGGVAPYSVYSLANPTGGAGEAGTNKLTRGARGGSTTDDIGGVWVITGGGGGYGNFGGGGEGWYRTQSGHNNPGGGGAGGYNAAGGAAAWPSGISGGAPDPTSFNSDIDNSNFKNGVLYFKIGSGAAGGWGVESNGAGGLQAYNLRPKRGGGAINLITNQLNLVSGEISADAEAQDTEAPFLLYTGKAASGGSGGGIFIHTNKITGNTMIANSIHAKGSRGETYNVPGKNPRDTNATKTAGTGGGGIIILSYGVLATDSSYDNFDNSVGRWTSGSTDYRLPLFKKVQTSPLSLVDVTTLAASNLTITKSTYDKNPGAGRIPNAEAKPKTTFNAGEEIWVQILVNNVGGEVTGVTISDNVFKKENSNEPLSNPSGSISPSSGVYSNGVVTWSNQTIPASNSMVYVYRLLTP